ncbi:MAG: anti-sigma factor [Planctomycetota bacterium]
MSTQLISDITNGGDERLLELLAGESLGDLSSDERRELDTLVADLGPADRTCMERTAASLALISPQDDVPAGLSERLLDDLQHQPIAGPQAFIEAKAADVATTAAPSLLALTGWLAAAAALAAAFVIAVVRPEPMPVLTAQASYDSFVDQLPGDAVRHGWTNVMTEGVSGEVVWSDDAQRGYMVFEGLAANDPTVEQYQLWIFDAERPDATPVDGGVFDVKVANGKTYVRIDAKIDVREASWFAVTVEQPGGVVVSERANIPVVANMPA